MTTKPLVDWILTPQEVKTFTDIIKERKTHMISVLYLNILVGFELQVVSFCETSHTVEERGKALFRLHGTCLMLSPAGALVPRGARSVRVIS